MHPKRTLWSENNMLSTIQAVRRGSLRTYKASLRYNISRSTIRNHLTLEKINDLKAIVSKITKQILLSEFLGMLREEKFLIREFQSLKICSKNKIERTKKFVVDFDDLYLY